MGVVLAGGLGRRLGGSKASVRLNGRPLISYATEAIRAALNTVIVVAKADSELPSLPGVELWIEPNEPRHPLTGLVHALEQAEGRPVLVCACDLPLVSDQLIRAIADARPERGMAVVARAEGRLHPLLGRYEAGALAPLAAALGRGSVSVMEAVGGLDPTPYEVAQGELLFNVNTPEDLLRAGALLSAQPKVKS
jgi:molybdopterin-guanine dinucleotide biosynthesis protein A